jgi:hypothetical protein
MNEPTLLSPDAVAANLMAAPSEPAAPVPVSEKQIPITPDGKIDKGGKIFDPARHKSNSDGTPFLNRHGRFMPIGGRKKLGAAETTAPLVDDPAAPLNQPEPPVWSEAARAAAAAPSPEAQAAAGKTAGPAAALTEDQSDDAAEVLTQTLYFTVGVLIGSTEAATPEKSEHVNFCKAASAWIRTTGWKGTALTCFVLRVCAYLLRVARKPEAAETIQKWMRAFKEKKAHPVAAEPVKSNPEQKAEPAKAALITYPGSGFGERSAVG